MNMIETMHLTKEYSDFAAVSDINLHIRKGTVYGLSLIHISEPTRH